LERFIAEQTPSLEGKPQRESRSATRRVRAAERAAAELEKMGI
jgi:hypothetical protein